MEKHLTILSICMIAMGVLLLGIAALVFVAVAGGGLISGDGEAIAITATVATLVAGFLSVLAAPSIIAGIGLMRRANWARILTLIIAALNLLNFPLGTALGVYAFSVLLNDQIAPLFATRQAASVTPSVR